MVLCVLIVAGAVLFGIFGPGIAQRSQLGNRLALADLVSAAASMRDRLVAGALRPRSPTLRSDDEAERIDAEKVAGEMRAALGAEAMPPDLAGHGFELVSAGPSIVHGSSPDSFSLGYLRRDPLECVVLVLVPDDGRFVSFDEFGRPVALLPGRTLMEPLERAPGDESVALVWSTGAVVVAAIVPDAAAAAALRASLGAP